MNLDDKIESHYRLTPIQKIALKKLGLNLVRDLLFFFPNRYTDISQIRQINTLTEGEVVTIIGQISDLKTSKSFKSKIPMGKALLSDLTGSISIIWFHQPYLAKMMKDGSTVRVTGKVSIHKNLWNDSDKSRNK
jgi:ATP-dependent DNA helicase RecG